MINYTKGQDGIATLVLDMPGTSGNVLNTGSLRAIDQAVDKVIADDAVKGAILTSGKSSFILGGDLKEISALNDLVQIKAMFTEIHAIFRKMETCGKPFVAAINGTALGGGMEICLACHHRIAVNSPKIQMGFPEVNLGLLPGAGGTQRLPRMIGLEAAMIPLLQAKNYRPAAALKLGLIDALADSQEEMMEAARKWILEVGTAVQPWDVRGFRVPGVEIASLKATFMFAGAAGMVRQKTQGKYPAPNAILSCLYEGIEMNFDQALQLELKHFAKLALSKEAKHMIKSLWFSMNAAKAGASRPADVPRQKFEKVGILGAGMMGAGIAYVSAMSGIEVILKDVSKEGAEKGKDYARKLLAKRQERGRISAEKAEAVLARIHTTGDPADLSGCELVVEAVFEDRTLKARVTQESEAVMAEDGIFASNTSTLPITGLAGASKRPENFIGLHFFSPVDKMQLVEVIVGEATTAETLARAIDYVLQIRKIPIVVNDSRGFFTSRIFKTFVTEGFELLAEGVKPALIENAAKAAGMPVGPLAVADEVSISLLYHIYQQTEADGIVSEGAARDVINLFVEQLGRKGKKDGAGFYEYPAEGRKRLWKGIAEHFPPVAEQPAYEAIQRRILHMQAMESVRCLEEGVLRSIEDADIGSILGWGFPPYTGGVLSYIDYVGVAQFVADCEALEVAHGSRFAPTERLKAIAASGKTYSDAMNTEKAPAT